jgi:hypothetical protein
MPGHVLQDVALIDFHGVGDLGAGWFLGGVGGRADDPFGYLYRIVGILPMMRVI